MGRGNGLSDTEGIMEGFKKLASPKSLKKQSSGYKSQIAAPKPAQAPKPITK
jgi:hypothetical protein